MAQIIPANRKPVRAIKIDEYDASTTYVGEAPQGSATSAAVWRMKKIVKNGTVTTITYAGSGRYNQIWDDRTILTYS